MKKSLKDASLASLGLVFDTFVLPLFSSPSRFRVLFLCSVLLPSPLPLLSPASAPASPASPGFPLTLPLPASPSLPVTSPTFCPALPVPSPLLGRLSRFPRSSFPAFPAFPSRLPVGLSRSPSFPAFPVHSDLLILPCTLAHLY